MTENQLKASEQLSGEDWAGEMGSRWLANLDCFEQMIAPIGKALVERALFQSGERVIDIGSGGGAIPDLARSHKTTYDNLESIVIQLTHNVEFKSHIIWNWEEYLLYIPTAVNCLK